MAQQLNKAQIIGYLGSNPDIRYLTSGIAIAILSVATTDSWKDKETGENKDKTEWHRVVIYGKLAEVAGMHLKKGSLAYFEGQLRTRKWKDSIGAEHNTTEIFLNNNVGMMQMLGRKVDKEDTQNAPPENLNIPLDGVVE